ncbi:MAG: hypothetical protein IJY60_08035 [Bacteroides sp.]|nr:hypothetical protein [Bacteroides sp.]
MKRHYLFILLTFLCISLHAQKQGKGCSEEEFRAKKQAYLTEQAGLTEEESAKFFPIYYELQALKKDVNRKAWKKVREGKNPETTEAQYEDILNGFIDAEEQNCNLDKEYLKKYQSVLSNKKIYMVLRAEIKFNRNMLKIIQSPKKK